MRQLFISDLHLQPERPDIIRAFQFFLEKIAPNADKLYLLGDIFEYWIGDDAPMPGLESIYSALSDLARSGTAIGFMHGNRDFLVNTAFLAPLGLTLLPAIHSVQLGDQKAVLVHGDELCTDDVEYQKFRQLVRNPAWQQEFLAKTLQERVAMAKHLREKSREAAKEKQTDIMDVNASAVSEMMARYDTNILIHGHTHRPAIHTCQRTSHSGTRIVLGDWSSTGWYAEHTSGEELRLISFEAD